MPEVDKMFGGDWEVGWQLYIYFIFILYSSLEVEALQGNGSGILRIQDEVEMLVSAIQQTTHSMSRLAGRYPTSLHHFLYLFLSFCTVKTTIEEPKKTTFTDLEL